ncbi:hypothetical protein M3Y98_00560500 [Aphelenchoides besseyi]|nr:hypothetical protein M3Y98_00560500 [Aphelenchoides besseyi]
MSIRLNENVHRNGHSRTLRCSTPTRGANRDNTQMTVDQRDFLRCKDHSSGCVGIAHCIGGPGGPLSMWIPDVVRNIDGPLAL